MRKPYHQQIVEIKKLRHRLGMFKGDTPLTMRQANDWIAELKQQLSTRQKEAPN